MSNFDSMSNFEERIEQSARRGSAVAITENPLDSVDANVWANETKVETTNDAKPINPEQLMEIIAVLLSKRDDELAKELETMKQPYMFSSSDLLKILEITESLRARLAIILLIAPRLIDPRESLETVLQMFRFTEDKYKVEEAYKHRLQIINALNLKSEYVRNTHMFHARGGGRGGGGRGSNGSGIPRPLSMPESTYFKNMFRRYQTNNSTKDDVTTDGSS